MKCKVCDGSGITKGYDAILGNFFDMKCFACDGSGEVDHYEEEKEEPLTNEEWRKTCSTEDFAEALTKVVLNIIAWNNDPKPSEVRNVLKSWLKQPHKE